MGRCLAGSGSVQGLPGLPVLGPAPELAGQWGRQAPGLTPPAGRLQEPTTGAKDTEAGLRPVRTGVTDPVPSYPVPERAACGAAQGSHWRGGLRGPSPSACTGTSSCLRGACSPGADRGLIRLLQLRRMEAVGGRFGASWDAGLGANLGFGGLVVGLQNMATVCVI